MYALPPASLQIDIFWGRAKLLCILFFCTVSITPRPWSQLELHGICAVYLKTVAKVQISAAGDDFEVLEIFTTPILQC